MQLYFLEELVRVTGVELSYQEIKRMTKQQARNKIAELKKVADRIEGIK